MKQKMKMRKNSIIIIVALAILMLFFPVAILMNYVGELLNNDVRVNLTEIVSQNKNVIQTRITVELNKLDMVGDQIVEEMLRTQNFSDESLKKSFLKYSQEKITNDYFIVNTKGEAFFSDQVSLEVTGRNYFKLAMKGISNISDKIISCKDGTEVYIFSIPIYYNDQIIATLQKSYREDEINDIFALSLFSDQGYTYVVNQEGYILFHSKHINCTHLENNYFRDLYESGNVEVSKKLTKEIGNNKNGFFEADFNGEKYFAAYTPIENLHDWYLISSVSTQAISYNSSVVMKIFYIVLAIIILIFLLLAFVFWHFKNKRQKEVFDFAFVDDVTKGHTINRFLLHLQDTLHSKNTSTWSIWKFDIDNFKYINKYYSYEFGDKVLKNIVDHISNQLSEHEMIARIAGDNFVVLLKDASKERILSMLQGVASYESVMLYYSSGIYEIHDVDENANIMIDKASMVSNTVKEGANEKVAYYTKAFEESTKNEEELKRAIREAFDNDEFVAYYQPKVNVKTNEITGCEALARWQHPQKGLIPPNYFIPICEKSGLIMELDMRIFEKALQFIQRCQQTGVPVYPISVNFSRMHLLDESFLSKVISMIERYEVPRHLVELELTESAIFGNLDNILAFTNKLHDVGLTIAMDDFGSGYSSLNMLKEIPIDVLKVDKEFLSESSDVNRRRIIFESMVEMVRKLDIDIIVEGVETKEGVQLLKDCKCFFAQGYYFSKPVDEKSMEDMFRKGKVQ